MPDGYVPCQAFLGKVHLVPRAEPYVLQHLAQSNSQINSIIRVSIAFLFLCRKPKVDLNLSVKARLKILFFQLHTLRMIPRFTKILSRPLGAGPVSSRGPLEENQLLVVKTMKD